MHGYATVESCVQECMMNHEMNYCGCAAFSYSFLANYHFPLCFDWSLGPEYCRDFLIRTPESAECYKNCRVPCRQVEYDVKIASIKRLRNVPQKDKDLKFEMVVKFSTHMVTYQEFKPTIAVSIRF